MSIVQTSVGMIGNRDIIPHVENGILGVEE